MKDQHEKQQHFIFKNPDLREDEFTPVECKCGWKGGTGKFAICPKAKVGDELITKKFNQEKST